jgi:DNA-binding response OmpR family regulator
MPRILFVEDDPEMSIFVQDWLESEKFRVEHTADGADAWQIMEMTSFDLIILDWELPSIHGVELCRKFRAKGGTTPVLMLTGKGHLDDKVSALDVGADDYLTKPFHLAELSARLRALLRRGNVAAENKLIAGDIEIDRVKHEVKVRGAVVKLFPRDYDLLEFLMTNANTVYSADSLLMHVWNMDGDANETAVRSCIKNLRKKICASDEGCPIVTVHGVGYKFEK